MGFMSELAIERAVEGPYEDAFLEIMEDGLVKGSEAYLRIAKGIMRQMDAPRSRPISEAQREVVHQIVDQYLHTHKCRCGRNDVDDVIPLIRWGRCSRCEHYADD